jgi:septal ring factor EnvC (AmiA/AmiB activator)
VFDRVTHRRIVVAAGDGSAWALPAFLFCAADGAEKSRCADPTAHLFVYSAIMLLMREAWTDERLDDLSERMDRGFDRVDRDIRELKADVDRRFDKVDQQFDKVDQQFDKVDQQFDKVDQRFNKVDQRFDRIDDRFDRLEDRFAAMQRYTLATFLTTVAIIVAVARI